MSGTTSLDDLPTGSHNETPMAQPVKIEVTEQNSKVDMSALKALEEERNKMTVPTAQGGQPMTEEQTSLFVQGLQQASQQGVLSLPSREIPMNQASVKMDEAARVNYVPRHESETDYIGNTQTTDDIIRHNNMQKRKDDTIDSFYEEVHTPILISVLFFLFMIPSVRAFLFKSFPMLLKTDGNPTLGGYAYVACTFGLCYYILDKAVLHFSQV